MGKKRPISIIEIIRNAKAEARKIGGKTILKYFTLNQNGTYVGFYLQTCSQFKNDWNTILLNF